MPPGRRGSDTERGPMIMGPGVVYDAEGNPVGYADDFPEAPSGGELPPPTPGTEATGPNVPPPPGTPRTPTAPSGTAAPRTPAARRGRGNVISRLLRNAAGRLRGNRNR